VVLHAAAIRVALTASLWALGFGRSDASAQVIILFKCTKTAPFFIIPGLTFQTSESFRSAVHHRSSFWQSFIVLLGFLGN